MTASAADDPGLQGTADLAGAPACPCGDDMWYLAFGYDSWVCRTDPRHWYRPRSGRWSSGAQASVDRPGGS